MEIKLIVVFVFTTVIHLISTLTYSVKLVGVKTGRLAVSFAIFNVLALGSRFSNALIAPFLANFVEKDLPGISSSQTADYFSLFISAACLGTLLGGIATPTFTRTLEKLVLRFNIDRSIPKLLYHSFTNFGVKQLKSAIKVPSKSNLTHIKSFNSIPRKKMVLNSLAVALLTVGSFAALYAASLAPEFRLTISATVPLITGFATVMLVILIDPHFSLLADEIISGKKPIAAFQKSVFWLTISRFIGTLLAILLLKPCALLIVRIVA